LAGTLRRGSGIIGSGGVKGVAPVVIGLFCASEALIWTLPRAFGAGLGIGTVCADDDVTTDSVATPAIDAASATPIRRAWRRRRIVRPFQVCDFYSTRGPVGFGHFIVVSAKGDIVFP